MCAAFVDDGYVKILNSVRSIESAAVAVRLFLIVFARFDIYYGRSQFKRTVSVRSVA